MGTPFSDVNAGLARRLGPFDTTMIVMGGIIGSGIFMNPSVVARQLHSPALILAAWAAGGLIALVAAFIYAELAARRPQVGGQYAYIREAYHPLLAFVYGWGLLLVIQTGGMAASAVTFARYFVELTRASIPEWTVAVLALAGLTLVNCLGVRAGGTTQNALMVIKLAALVALIACGLVLARAAPHEAPGGGAAHVLGAPGSLDWLTAFGAALVPVLFAYGGGQTAAFVAGEVRDPRRNLPLGLIAGVLGVVALYLAVNVACLRVMGARGLAESTTQASDVMRAALGATGAKLIAAGIAISTLGFLSQSMLTAPRVYYAMAADGLFFRGVGWLDPRTHAPVGAIALQGVLAIVIALSGRYEQILNYVVSVDWIFFALSASCVFVLRRRDARAGEPAPPITVPGHPWTTALFVAVSAAVVASVIVKYPANSTVGIGILLAGVPVYFAWRGAQRRHIRSSAVGP